MSSRLEAVFPAAVFEKLAPYAELAERRETEHEQLLGLVKAVFREDLPEPRKDEHRVFDPGGGRPYVFVLDRPPLRLALATRGFDGSRATPVLVRTPPAKGPWPERIKLAAAELAPRWRRAVERLVARDEVDPKAELLDAWSYVGEPDQGFETIHVASDGTTTVLALEPVVHERFSPPPPAPRSLREGPVSLTPPDDE